MTIDGREVGGPKSRPQPSTYARGLGNQDALFTTGSGSAVNNNFRSGSGTQNQVLITQSPRPLIGKKKIHECPQNVLKKFFMKNILQVYTSGGYNLNRSRSYSGGMYGAASRPMAWNGGGSTQPPVANNYLDSHGLNSGLGNAATTQFPSVVDTKPMQA